MQRTLTWFLLASAALVLHGCASVPLDSIESDTRAKTFVTPPGKANIYVYRNESFGAAVRFDLEIDGEPVGQTAARTYFVFSVPPGKHSLMSRAENDFLLDVTTEPNRNYFVWQEVKMGLLYARNKLQLVDEATGKAGVAECRLVRSIVK